MSVTFHSSMGYASSFSLIFMQQIYANTHKMSNKYIIFVGHDSFIKKWKTRSNATELLPRDRVNSVFACEKRQFILSNWLLAFRKMCVSLWLLVALAVKDGIRTWPHAYEMFVRKKEHRNWVFRMKYTMEILMRTAKERFSL